jgi:polyphosphate glucokinase
MATQAHTPVIGIDIGGTAIKGGMVDLRNGRLIGEQSIIPTPQFALPERVADAVASMVAGLQAAHPQMDAARPVGVTFPGIIHQGVARSSANVDDSWVGLDVGALMSARLGRETAVVNDADAAGLAEMNYGGGRGVQGLVLAVTLGTGIGSALIIDGRLVPNAELGHLEIDGHKAEHVASALARERDGIDWKTYADRLQRYFSHLEFLFSPDLFIVGGGISQRSADFLPHLDLRTKIVPAQLRNSAGTVGAALRAASYSSRSAAVTAGKQGDLAL